MKRLSYFVTGLYALGFVFCIFSANLVIAANNVAGGNPASTSVFLRWADKNGTINFTDDINTVPEDFRNKVEVVGNAYALLSQRPRSTTYSFRPNSERITLTAKLNDKTSVKFLLNMEAAQSILIPKVAKELGFDEKDPSNPQITTTSGEEVSKTPVMKIEQFDLQGRIVKNFHFAVTDISEKDICSGILGKDFFNHFIVNFNRESGKLVLTEKKR